MIKKIYTILFIMIISLPAFSIQWEQIKTISGKQGCIDLDSIKQTKGYYFYNIKVPSRSDREDVVMTVQSSLSHAFSSVVKTYNESEYNSLNGNYEYIADYVSDKLDAPEYGSIVYSAYRIVKSKMSNDIEKSVILE